MDAMAFKARIDLADLIEPFVSMDLIDLVDLIGLVDLVDFIDLVDFMDFIAFIDCGINFLECTDRIDGLDRIDCMDRIDWAARRERTSCFFAACKCCTNALVASGAGRFASAACVAGRMCVSTSGCGGACRWG